MIRLAHTFVEPKELVQQWNLDHIGMIVLHSMSASEEIYDFEYLEQLHFEIALRSNLVKSAYELQRAGVDFATFDDTRCNPQYWELLSNGGFLLKDGVLPSTGIRDIFRHGGRYAFECTMAVVIVLYKGMLDTIPDEKFNQLFGGLYLWDGHYDENLQLETLHETHYLPGDILYVKNPEVNPEEIEWQGENIVDLGNGTYYGHGIGIATIRSIIDHLNRHRIPGATVSAYLTDHVLRPDFKRLASLDGSARAMTLRETEVNTVNTNPFKGLVVAQVGKTTYILD
jgi:protein-glutamine gamma-glutamyltransferase